MGSSSTGSTSGSSGSTGAFTSPYPRLGGYVIGGSSPRNYGTAAFMSWASKQQVVILNIWDGWEHDGQSALTMSQIIQQIKAQSPLPVPTYVVMYIDGITQPYQGVTSNSADYTYWQAMNANHWWVYDSYPSGSVAPSWFSSNYGMANLLPGGPVDSAGRDYAHYMVEYTNDYLVDGDSRGLAHRGNSPDPYVDGFFHDDTDWQTLAAGDWDRDGVSEGRGNLSDSAGLRQGEVEMFNYRAQLNPGRLLTANLVEFGFANAVSTDFQGILQGGVLESMLGESWSFESSGFSQAMAAYQRQMALLIPPALGVFGHDHLTTDGADPTDSTPYRAMRYGLGLCLLGDAYYFGNTSYGPSSVLWFDEYDNAGQGVGYLGQALQPAQTAPWQSGVWRRDFEHGSVLVNPKGNGPQTVTLEKTFHHLLGTQDPQVNDGSATTSVTLADRDAVILLQ